MSVSLPVTESTLISSNIPFLPVCLQVRWIACLATLDGSSLDYAAGRIHGIQTRRNTKTHAKNEYMSMAEWNTAVTKNSQIMVEYEHASNSNCWSSWHYSGEKVTSKEGNKFTHAEADKRRELMELIGMGHAAVELSLVMLTPQSILDNV